MTVVFVTQTKRMFGIERERESDVVVSSLQSSTRNGRLLVYSQLNVKTN